MIMLKTSGWQNCETVDLVIGAEDGEVRRIRNGEVS